MPISFSILANRSNKHIIMIHMTVITNMSIPSVCAILDTNMERKDVLQPIFYHEVYQDAHILTKTTIKKIKLFVIIYVDWCNKTSHKN